MDVEALVRPVVEGAGLELVGVSFRKEGHRRVLRVTVDREGGVDLDAISETSERLSRRLDLEDLVPGPYSLEVSSPGLERPLASPRDFRRALGERVKVRTTEPVDGRRKLAGTIVAADEGGLTLATDDGERRLWYEDVLSARTVVDWAEALRGQRERQA